MGFFRSWNKNNQTGATDLVKTPFPTTLGQNYGLQGAAINSNYSNYLVANATTLTNGAYTVTTIGGVGSGGYVPAHGGYLQPGTSNNNVNAVWSNAPLIGPPSGYSSQITFYDAYGNPVHIEVDQAYTAILQNISTQHQYGISGQSLDGVLPTLTKPVMVDGEFSYDEMEKAELLIEELNATSEESHQ